jgi:signal transduction histidine kinase
VDTFIRRRDEDAFKVIGENIGIFLDNAIHYSERTRSERLATLGKMGTMIIHEIKNPLGIIKSSVGALKNRLDLKPPEKELIQFIEEEADRINNTVRKVLDYARPPEAILCPIEIQDVLKRSVKMLEPQMQEHKINCNLKIYEGSAIVNGDANLLHQAFVNILTNSIEVMQKGGTINISLVLLWENDIDTGKSDGIVEKMKELGVRVVKSFAGSKKVRIIIEDDGPGIKEEEKDKIFEPFYTTKQDGTGLGLAITKHIIEVHKGMIKAEPGNQKGTRFIIELPVTG